MFAKSHQIINFHKRGNEIFKSTSLYIYIFGATGSVVQKPHHQTTELIRKFVISLRNREVYMNNFWTTLSNIKKYGYTLSIQRFSSKKDTNIMCDFNYFQFLLECLTVESVLLYPHVQSLWIICSWFIDRGRENI